MIGCILIMGKHHRAIQWYALYLPGQGGQLIVKWYYKYGYYETKMNFEKTPRF